jgi:hypothetical protein
LTVTPVGCLAAPEALCDPIALSEVVRLGASVSMGTSHLVGLVFSVVVLTGMALSFGALVRRRRQEAPLRHWIAEQPVLFETRALVRIRASGMEGSGWVTLKSAAGARLIVHRGGLEASIGSANILISGNFMRPQMQRCGEKEPDGGSAFDFTVSTVVGRIECPWP